MAEELGPLETNALRWVLFQTAYSRIASDQRSDAQSKWFELKRWLELMGD